MGISLNDKREVQKETFRDLMKLQHNTKSFDIFTFPAYNGKPRTTLVNVPSSTQMFHFHKNGKHIKTLDAIPPPKLQVLLKQMMK
jgi:hypothetical protein